MNPIPLTPAWHLDGRLLALFWDGITPLKLTDTVLPPLWQGADVAPLDGAAVFDILDWCAGQPWPELGAGQVLRLSLADAARAPGGNLPGGNGQFWLRGIDTPDELAVARTLKPTALFGRFWRAGTGQKVASTDHMTLLHLLDRLNADCETHELEALIGRSPTLLYSLLRLVNSVSVRGGGQRIASISHAIITLGRRQLQRWVTLLLYAERFDGTDLFSPLLLMTSLRARLMENLSLVLWPGQRARAELAFMTGMLSLLDVVMNQPLEQLLRMTALDELGEDALLRGEGPLAPLLVCAHACENGDALRLDAQLQALGVSTADWHAQLLAAWSWVETLRRGEEG